MTMEGFCAAQLPTGARAVKMSGRQGYTREKLFFIFLQLLGSTDITFFSFLYLTMGSDHLTDKAIKKYRQRKMAICLCVINNGNMTDWSLIRSLTVGVIF